MQTISEQNGTTTSSVRVLTITNKGILLSLSKGDFFLSYDNYPWFYNAKVEDVFDVKMDGNDAIRWDKLDVDLEIDSILEPQKYPLIAN